MAASVRDSPASRRRSYSSRALAAADVSRVASPASWAPLSAREAPRGSRVIGVNGAAARLVQKGDKVIVVTYCQLDASEARNYNPTVVLLDDGNEIKRAA